VPAARPKATYLICAFGLFLLWSNSVIAASYLLGTESVAARFDWVSLSVARFAPIVPICLVYCCTRGRRDSLRLLRTHPIRLLTCSLLAVPSYNLALYYGQQHGVPPPIASLTTALVPLFVMILAAIFLGESLTLRKTVAFCLACFGLVLIALSKGDPGEIAQYGLTLAITALAPLSWSIYSILSKPVFGAASPLVWTYLCIVVGSLPLLVVFPFRGGPEMSMLSAPGWFALLYLSILCTVVGYGIWTWLLRHLPASTLSFTVFFNPPLTTINKVALAALFPSVFVIQPSLLEWVGGLLALTGLAIALRPTKKVAWRQA
ncbi:MAG: DMT family transporter, partial [Acidobacteriota bacterium]